MENLIFSQIPIDDLKIIISDTIRAEMQRIATPTPPPETEYITRNQCARILGVSLPTLNDWTKRGLIIGYRIGTRVRYKKGEIMDAVKQMQTLKYRRGA
jgi:excisionase family DNA binding protein